MLKEGAESDDARQSRISSIWFVGLYSQACIDMVLKISFQLYATYDKNGLTLKMSR